MEDWVWEGQKGLTTGRGDTVPYKYIATHVNLYYMYDAILRGNVPCAYIYSMTNGSTWFYCTHTCMWCTISCNCDGFVANNSMRWRNSRQVHTYTCSKLIWLKKRHSHYPTNSNCFAQHFFYLATEGTLLCIFFDNHVRVPFHFLKYWTSLRKRWCACLDMSHFFCWGWMGEGLIVICSTLWYFFFGMCSCVAL